MPSSILEIRDLAWKYHGGQLVLNRISFDVHKNEILGFIGPNGCGKTTLLHLIAGILSPTQDGDLAGHINLKVSSSYGSRFGFVFQNYKESLLPWRTLYGNVMAGLELMRMKSGQSTTDGAVASEWLDRLGLRGLGERFPYEISGGQGQLACLARALALDAPILLLDEPTSSLHYEARNRVLELLLRERQESGRTVIFTSHSLEEAALLGDRVIVLTQCPSVIHAIKRTQLGPSRRVKQLGSRAHLTLYKQLVSLTSNLA